MAALRNKYLDRVRTNYSDWDYVLVWDMDTIGSLYVDGLLSSVADLKQNPGIDAVCANGLYVWPGIKLYYDTFAHSEENLDDMIATFGGGKMAEHILTTLWTKTWPTSEPVYPVKGCFSGATLYRMGVFLRNKYESKNLQCEHNSLGKNQSLVVNQNMVNYILLNL
jgi:hypothetical protein